MNELLSETLWPRIRELAKNSYRKYAAVAYVTDDRFVKFGKGDILVTDASDQAIKTGQTSANVLRSALKRGAAVYSIPGLHAKLYVFDSSAIISSANLSKESEKRTEIGMVTDSPRSVAAAISMVEKLRQLGNPIDAKFVDRVLKLSVSKRIKSPNRSKTYSIETDVNCWLISLYTPKREVPKIEGYDDAYEVALSNISNKDSDAYSIRIKGRSKLKNEIKPGDLVIQIWNPNKAKKPRAVYRHAPVVNVVRDANTATVFIEEFPDEDDMKISWSRFKQLYQQIGIPRPLKIWTTRKIANHYSDALATLWDT